MKTKNEYLKEQGIDLEKDLDVGTYTKIRFAMEQYAVDYHENEVKKFCLGGVVGRSEQLKCRCENCGRIVASKIYLDCYGITNKT